MGQWNWDCPHFFLLLEEGENLPQDCRSTAPKSSPAHPATAGWAVVKKANVVRTWWTSQDLDLPLPNPGWGVATSLKCTKVSDQWTWQFQQCLVPFAPPPSIVEAGLPNFPHLSCMRIIVSKFGNPMQPQHYPKFVISNDDEEINGDKEYPSGKTTMFPSFCRIFFPSNSQRVSFFQALLQFTGLRHPDNVILSPKCEICCSDPKTWVRKCVYNSHIFTWICHYLGQDIAVPSFLGDCFAFCRVGCIRQKWKCYPTNLGSECQIKTLICNQR